VNFLDSAGFKENKGMSKESHISERSPVKKSAFSPIRPSASAIERAKAAAIEAKAKQELPAPQKAAPAPQQVFLPTQVQTWAEVVDRPDRSVFGWPFFAGPRRASIAVIGIAINIDHWLVKRALVTQDAPLIAYVLGMCLGELLTYRARHTPWLPVLLEKLREALFKGRGDDLRKLNGVQFLGGELAQTPAFKNASADLLAPGGSDPGKKHLVATISLGKGGDQG
jgi:hypothetical protein